MYTYLVVDYQLCCYCTCTEVIAGRGRQLNSLAELRFTSFVHRHRALAGMRIIIFVL